MGLYSPPPEPISAYVEYLDIGENYANINFDIENNGESTIYVNINGDYCDLSYELTEDKQMTIEGLKSVSEFFVNIGIKEEDGKWVSLVKDSTFTTKLCTQSMFDPNKGIQYSLNRKNNVLSFNIKNCISDDLRNFTNFSAKIFDHNKNYIEMEFVGSEYDTQFISLDKLEISQDTYMIISFIAKDDKGQHNVSVKFVLNEL